MSDNRPSLISMDMHTKPVGGHRGAAVVEVIISYCQPGAWVDTDWKALDEAVSALPSLERVALQFGHVVGRWKVSEADRHQILQARIREKLARLTASGKLSVVYKNPDNSNMFDPGYVSL